VREIEFIASMPMPAADKVSRIARQSAAGIRKPILPNN
jgi:hypothetical protein